MPVLIVIDVYIYSYYSLYIFCNIVIQLEKRFYIEQISTQTKLKFWCHTLRLVGDTPAQNMGKRLVIGHDVYKHYS